MTSAALRTSDFSEENEGSYFVHAKTYQKLRIQHESPLELIAGGPLDGNLSLKDRHKQLVPVPKTAVDLTPRHFQLIQQWEGVVKAVSHDAFTCVLADKTNRENFDEEVEIDLSEVPDGDERLLRPGACFYWSIGYESGPGLPRQRVSRIRLQRLPGLTRRQIAKAERNALKLSSLFE